MSFFFVQSSAAAAAQFFPSCSKLASETSVKKSPQSNRRRMPELRVVVETLPSNVLYFLSVSWTKEKDALISQMGGKELLIWKAQGWCQRKTQTWSFFDSLSTTWSYFCVWSNSDAWLIVCEEMCGIRGSSWCSSRQIGSEGIWMAKQHYISDASCLGSEHTAAKQ